MIETKDTGGLVLRCNSKIEVLQVLFSSFSFNPATILNKPFAALAQLPEQGPVLHFIEALKQFGSADGWHLYLQLDDEPYRMTFSGVTMYPDFILVGSKYIEPTVVSFDRKILSKDIVTNTKISLEDNKAFTAEMNETELLDELSRLNNELNNNNNKRELSRKNIILEQIKQKKSDT